MSSASRASVALKAAFVALGLALGLAPGRAAASAYTDEEIRRGERAEERQVRELRNQETTQLRIALGRRLPSNRRADLYLRLAEIYLEAYRMEFLLEGRAHDRRLEAGMPDKTLDRSRSRPYLALGIKACQEIIRLGIQHDRLDKVYYFLGFNYSELGSSRESQKYFDFLTRKFPSSPLAGEAYRELGDAAYDAIQYRRAQDYYEEAVRRAAVDSNGSRVGENLPRVLHRLAWSYYRTKQFERAIATLKDGIRRASQQGEKFLSLKEEALRDMAVFMTEAGQVDQALEYFQSVAGDKAYYPRVLERLGRQYERNVEPKKATQVYESLLKTHPDDEAAFRVRVKLVDLDLRRGRTSEALGRVRGAKLLTGGELDTETAAKNLKAMVRRTATENHEAFRKSGSKPALAVAEEYYLAYLELFLSKDDPRKETPEIQMYLAEVKREIGKAKDASALYKKVLDSGDKRYAKEAGALWTASLAEAIRRLGSRAGAAEPSAIEMEFIEAADEMEDALGDLPEGREAVLRAAQVLAGYPSTRDDAFKRAKKIVAAWPKTAQGLTAARLCVQVSSDQLPKGAGAQVEKSDAAEDLKETIQDLRENAALMAYDRETGGRLQQLLVSQESRLKVGAIARQEAEKDYAAAGRSYEQFAAETASRDLADKAFANAVAAFSRVGDPEAVARVLDAWQKRDAGSSQLAESTRSAATLALIQGSFAVAASLFERRGRSGDADALETAARIREGAADPAGAQGLWSAYVQKHPKGAGRWRATLALARLEETKRDDAAAARHYRECLGGPAEVEAECGARLGDLYLRAQDVGQAKAIFRRSGKKGRRLSPYVAYSRYRLAELLEKDGGFQPLQMPEDRLKKGVTQRLEFLEPLSRAYSSAVEAGGPWAIAALERLANWAAGFADEVDGIQPPTGSTPAQVAQFRRGLATVVEPLRRKAIETWKDAYRKAVSNEILSPAVPAIGDRLADARQASPGRAQGYRGKFRLGGIPSDGGADGRSAAMEKTRERLVQNARDAAAWVDYGNLLWGEGRPLLARLAYERALGLDGRNPSALNNRAVVALSGAGEEDWYVAAESNEVLKRALAIDDLYLAAKMNRAALLNYYRLFARAKPLWEQVNARAQTAEGFDGLAVALQGLGDGGGAEAAFARADGLGAPAKRFTRGFHRAGRAGAGTEGAERCMAALGDVDDSAIAGFERDAFDRLQRTCTAWKNDTKQ